MFSCFYYLLSTKNNMLLIYYEYTSHWYKYFYKYHNDITFVSIYWIYQTSRPKAHWCICFCKWILFFHPTFAIFLCAKTSQIANKAFFASQHCWFLCVLLFIRFVIFVRWIHKTESSNHCGDAYGAQSIDLGVIHPLLQKPILDPTFSFPSTWWNTFYLFSNSFRKCNSSCRSCECFVWCWCFPS